MDQRRQLFSAMVAVSLFFGWMQVAPLLFPDMFPPPKPAGKNQPAAAKQADDKPAAPADVAKAENQEPGEVKPGDEPAPTADAATLKVAEFPAKVVTLGDAGFDAGYLIKVELNSHGASVDSVWLTDPRYTTEDRMQQLKLVGNEVKKNVGAGPVPRTFETSIPEIDKALEAAGLNLATINWEVLPQKDASSVTFRFPSPSGDLEVFKTYSIAKADLNTRDTSVDGYMLDVVFTIRNLAEKELTTEYSLQGPVGLPLENAANTRLFREIKLGSIENPNYPTKVTATNLLASALVKQFDNSRKEGGKAIVTWRAPLHYAGVDDQFFAALVMPSRQQDGKSVSQIAVTRPELLYIDRQHPDRSNLSIVMDSPELKVPAKSDVVDEYKVFFGPKRPKLMQALNAEAIIQLGWFAPVAKLMLIILGFFHSVLQMPYALAIIALTVVVRGAMIPISRKQAVEAEKMKILAPRMKELQDRYKGKPEEFARAYREFQKKHKYNPMMGCLPALIQLPIFLGLYNSLYHAVDLRLAKFLWIDNLATPDQLFHLPFTVPYFGWTEFNLLPFITVALFVVQQKLFTPPPTSDEQALQYKMMNYMMIFIGFAFYTVPAGLCLYFIASSLWGICERLLLKKSLATHQAALLEAQKEDAEETQQAAGGSVGARPKLKGSAPVDDSKSKAPTWWSKIREAADQAKNTTEAQASQRKFSKDKGKGPNSRR